MKNPAEINEINAWANILLALGQEGHDNTSGNQQVLREITKLVKEELESLTKTD